MNCVVGLLVAIAPRLIVAAMWFLSNMLANNFGSMTLIAGVAGLVLFPFTVITWVAIGGPSGMIGGIWILAVIAVAELSLSGFLSRNQLRDRYGRT